MSYICTNEAPYKLEFSTKIKARNIKHDLNHPLFQDIHNIDVEGIYRVCEQIQKYKYIVIVGIGGSILIPMTLIHATGNNSIRYLHTVEPEYINNLLQSIEVEDTIFIVISKSGYTIETVTIFEYLIDYLKPIPNIKLEDHFLLITGNDNHMRRVGQKIKAPILDHPDTGGRFSVFSVVGLIPAYLAGIDIDSLILGGKMAISHLNNNNNYVDTSVSWHIDMMERGLHNSVIMPYTVLLSSFTDWYAQLIAESLGKNNQGITPIKALGPLDQHSQLQLYLEGRKDKFFNIYYIERGKSSHHVLQNILYTEYQALQKSLQDYNLPHRSFTIKERHAYSLGYLMMQVMTEIVALGKVMNINPFDQPAVENIKSHIKTLLG